MKTNLLKLQPNPDVPECIGRHLWKAHQVGLVFRIRDTVVTSVVMSEVGEQAETI